MQKPFVEYLYLYSRHNASKNSVESGERSVLTGIYAGYSEKLIYFTIIINNHRLYNISNQKYSLETAMTAYIICIEK